MKQTFFSAIIGLTLGFSIAALALHFDTRTQELDSAKVENSRLKKEVSAYEIQNVQLVDALDRATRNQR